MDAPREVIDINDRKVSRLYPIWFPSSSSSLSTSFFFSYDQINDWMSILFMMFGLMIDELSTFQIYLTYGHGSFELLWIDDSLS